MNEEVQAVLAQMETLLAALRNCPAETFRNRRRLPNRGVYAFCEGDRILYIGRSNQIWERVRTHGRNGATQEQANFAFRLLAREYDLEVGHNAPANRREIAAQYAVEFREQKQRVRNMTIKAVAIYDDTVSYFFEAYAILALGTLEFNRFEPH